MSDEMKPRPVEELVKDRMFLSATLQDPRKALISYGVRIDNEDLLIAIVNAAEGELAHWAAVLEETIGPKGTANFCNICMDTGDLR